MCKLAIILFTLLLAKSIWAANPPISVSELAAITGYPAEKINVVDTTIESNERAAKKKKPSGISNHYYSSNDGSFAELGVAIGKKGTLLTPELAAKFSKTLLIPNYPGNLKELTIGDEIKGYSGIGMAGAGGSMHRSVVSLMNLDRDIQVTVSLGEDGVTPLAGAEAYRETVLKFEGVNTIIEKCLTAVSNNVIASLGSGVTTESMASPQVQQIKPTAPSQQTASKDAGVIEPKDQTPRESSRTWLLWVLGFALIILVFITNALRKRSR
jgi:hypothetical protein